MAHMKMERFESSDPREELLQETEGRVAEQLDLEKHFPKSSENARNSLCRLIAEHDIRLREVLDYTGLLQYNVSDLTDRSQCSTKSFIWRDLEEGKVYYGVYDEKILINKNLLRNYLAYIDKSEQSNDPLFNYYREMNKVSLVQQQAHEIYHIAIAHRFPTRKAINKDDFSDISTNSPEFLRYATSLNEQGAEIFSNYYCKQNIHEDSPIEKVAKWEVTMKNLGSLLWRKTRRKLEIKKNEIQKRFAPQMKDKDNMDD